MRILMLGWEFPPFVAGGLGVACYGLTRSLDRMGHTVIFVLPKPVDRSFTSHVRLLSPEAMASAVRRLRGVPVVHIPNGVSEEMGTAMGEFEHAEFHGVAASFSSPYAGFDPGERAGLEPGVDLVADAVSAEELAQIPLIAGSIGPGGIGVAGVGGVVGMGGGAGHGYGGDLIGDAERYARLVVALGVHEQFDVIHAHDWLTYPAGLALARVMRKPLVVHVHSTEFDRAGNNVNQQVYAIERAGMHGADRVVAVSQFTASICTGRYGVPGARIDVCYNGVEREAEQPAEGAAIESTDKIVLFLGRITMQKGPEYFIAAARRVLEKVDHVKFVVAGSGDMALRMIELAASMGIGHKVLFTGFLHGRDVQRVFEMADCYVMPSVSEPFGIAALEAIQHDVPVILSKTSGASEVLTHVLKVDFWDIDEMANKIIAVLRHPPLARTLREHGAFEVRRLTWGGAAEKCLESYQRAIDGRAAAKRA